MRRPSVASSKGDKPTELRIMTASESPREGLLYVASWQQAPTRRIQHRRSVYIHPEDRLKPWRLQRIMAIRNNGE